MGKVKVNANKFTQITLTTEGIENVSVVSGSGKASIEGDTLYLDFPTMSSDIDTSTFITSASINSGSVSVEGNTLMIDIPTVASDIDTSTFITSASINAGSVSVEGNKLYINLDTDTTVSDVSIVGGDLFASIDSGTLYLLAADNPTKANPNLAMNPASATISTDPVTILANSDSDSPMNFYSDSNAVSLQTFANKVICAANSTLGSANVYCLSPENANYYAQYKVVPVTVKIDPIIDFYVENGQIKSTSNTVWQTTGDNIYIGDDFASVGNNSYFYTEVDNNNDFADSDFTIFYNFTQLSGNRQYAGPLSFFQANAWTKGCGIFTDGGGFFSWFNTTTVNRDCRVSNLSQNTPAELKIVRNGDNVNFYVDDVLSGNLTADTSPISKANNLITLGNTLVDTGFQTKISSFKLFKLVLFQ